MKVKIKVKLSLLVMGLLALKAFCEPSAKELLNQSQLYFDQGQYAKALSLIAHLDVRVDFDSTQDMINALKIRAISYCESNNLDHARETIRELLFIDPAYKFDPFDTPKKVIETALEESKEILEKNQQLALLKNRVTSVEASKKALDIKYKPSFFLTLLPFGINHFSLGSPTKGAVYLSLQAGSLLANIGAFWWKQSYLEKAFVPRLASYQDKKRFQAAQITQFVALSTLITAFGVSIIDAMIGFQEGKL